MQPEDSHTSEASSASGASEAIADIRRDLLSRLSGVEEHPGYWSALCPAHEDARASLSVREHEDGVSVKCHTGCDSEAVLAAVGLTKADLYPKETLEISKPSHSSAKSEYYYYTDEEGNILFRVWRTPSKGFPQQRYDSESGKFVNGLNGTGPVLYHLPELANRPDEPVFVVEGEKDTDRLIAEGLLATTSPMGAGKWKPEYAKWLQNRTVYILPDNDEPGEKHAKDIAKTLPKAKIIRLPNLPRKGDVSDWLDAGGSPERLLEIAQNPPKDKARVGGLVTFTAFELSEKKFPAVRWVVPGLIPEGTMLLAGKPKMGKSWFALQLCIAVAIGGRALEEIEVDQGEALYLALEDNERRLQDRLSKLLEGRGAPKGLHMTTVSNRVDSGLLEDLEEFLETRPDVRLVVIDTMVKVRPQNSNRQTLYEQDYEAVTALTDLAGDYNVAIILVHHLKKGEAEDVLDLISGSTGLTGGVDGALVLNRTRSAADAILKAAHRDLKDDPELALAWDADRAVWKLIGDAEEYRMGKERREILDVLANADEPMKPMDVAEILGKTSNTISQALGRMKEDGYVDTAGYAKYIVAPGMVPPPRLSPSTPSHTSHSVILEPKLNGEVRQYDKYDGGSGEEEIEWLD